ncbi:hypothetical protein [Paenibacillus macerans]|uniref:hypothetical protein n=1 Tax=Paenibacillus macerans TaxID=44252 RepID=UPI003D315DED
MKKKIVIISSVVVFLAVAFLTYDYFYTVYQREHRSAPVPTGTVQYFDMETEKAIKIFSAKSNSLDILSNEDQEYIERYFDKYLGNPRLSDAQNSICTKVVLLDTSYRLYIDNKDSKKKKDIESSNEAIQTFFNALKSLQNSQ